MKRISDINRLPPAAEAAIKIFLIGALSFSFAQWEPEVRMTNTVNSEYTSPSNAWCIAAGPNPVVHMVYWYPPVDPGNYEIYYCRSTNAGTSWSVPIRLTNAPLTSQQPCLAVKDSNIYLVYMDYRNGNDYEIYFQRSTDVGLTWGQETRLTNDPGISNNPCIAVSGNNLYVAYDDQRGGLCYIYYRRSTDRGATWEPEVRLTGNTYYPAFPCIAAIGNYVHLVWMDWREPKGSVYYRRSTDYGVSWEPEVGLVLVDSFTYSPCLAVSNSHVHLTWNDYRYNDSEIFYKRSDDNGMNWTPDIRITNAWGISQDPNIAVSGNNVFIVFDENRGDWDIMFTMSTNGGNTWTTPIFLCSAPNRSFYPSITTDGSALHVVWHDMRDGNREIYYRRNPNALGVEEGFPPRYLRIKPRAITVRRVLNRLLTNGELLDISGRKVTYLHPGVYFIRSEPSTNTIRKVVLTE